MEPKKQDSTIIYLILFFGLIFILLIFADRSNGQEGEPIIEEPKASTTISFKSDLEIFNELPDFQKYEITLDAKEASDNLASKYAKLYDTCRFVTGFTAN